MIHFGFFGVFLLVVVITVEDLVETSKLAAEIVDHVFLVSSIRCLRKVTCFD